MKNLILLAVLFALKKDLYAQRHNIGPELTGGIVFHTFTNSASVSQRKRNKLGSGSAYTYGVGYTYITKKNLVFKTGLHIGNNFVNIKGGDGFRVFDNRIDNFLWVRGSDSLNLLKTEHTLRTLVIPTGIGQSTPLGKRKRSFFYAGIELQHQLLLKSITNVIVDTSFKKASGNQIQLIEKEYNNLAKSYMVSIQPILDFDLYLSDQLRLKINANPIKVYLNSWYKDLHKKLLEFNFAMITVRYNL
jgi:hypothetical protein